MISNSFKVGTPFNASFETIYEKPYIFIPFPLGRIQIEKAMESFLNFLTLPYETKQHIDLKIAPLHRRGDIGYKQRDPEEDIYNDRKEFFHYHPIIWEHYTPFINANPILKSFLEYAHPLWQIVYDLAKDTLSGFEKDYPGTVSKVFQTKEPHILLRFLKYDFAQAGLYLAKPHFDAGSFTIAIAESGPGLRIGTNPDDLELISHQEGQAIFMISSNYRKIIDTDKLKPGWHDVIQLDHSKINQPYSRWALVAFIEGHSVESLSRSETHKYSQVKS